MEKEIITKAEIEQDIIHAVKHPARTPRLLYFVRTAAIFAVTLGIFFSEPYIGKDAYFLAAAVFLAVILQPAVKIFIRNRKIARLSIDDYVIRKSVIKKKKHEKYVVITKRRITLVNNYNLFFEKEKVWHIPAELYLWSEINCMSDMTVYEKAAQGEVFYTVCEKKSGKIVMAYSTEIFEYSE